MRIGRSTALVAGLAALVLVAPAGAASAARVVADEAAYIAPRLDAQGDLELGILRTAYDGGGEQWSSAAETVVHAGTGSATTVPGWAAAFGLTGFGAAGAPLWLTGEGATTEDAAARGTVLLGWTRELLYGHLSRAGSAGTVRALHVPPGGRAASLGIYRPTPGEDPSQVTITLDTDGGMAPARWEIWRQGSGYLNRRRATQAWAFSGPGYHCVDVESRATLASGRPVYDRQPIAVAVGAVDPQLAPACPDPGGETETVLSATPRGPVEAGSELTLTATVGPTSATGSVQFFDDDGSGAAEQPLGDAIPVEDGAARLTTTMLAPGRHTVRAAFQPADPDTHGASTATLTPLRVFSPAAYVLETAADESVHADVAVRGDDDAFGLWLKVDGTSPRWQPLGESILAVPDRARETVPADPRFAFLAPAGSDLWTVPLTQAAGVPWLGISSESIEEAAFQRYASWRLDGVSTADGGPAPGEFMLWNRSDGAKPFFSTRVGLPDAVRVLDRLGGHWHANWSFTAPGIYCLNMSAANRRAATGAPVADEQVLTVVVGDAIDPYRIQTCAQRGVRPTGTHPRTPAEAPAGTAHLARTDEQSSERDAYDLQPQLRDGALRVAVLEGDPGGPGTLHGPEDVVFHVGPTRELGESTDANRYVLGSDMTALDGEDLTGDLSWRLVALEGPGELTIGDEWHDHRGGALLSSIPGTVPDGRNLWAGRRDGLAWRFSAPGAYCATFEWSGTSGDGGALRDQRTLTFAVDVDPAAVVPCARRTPMPPDPPAQGPDERPPGGEQPPTGEPPRRPLPPSGRPRPVRVRLLGVDRRLRLAQLLRRGTIAARCRLSAPGTCTVRATVGIRTARRLGWTVPRGATTVELARGRVTLRRAGDARVVLRMKPAARRAVSRARSGLRIGLHAHARASGRTVATARATMLVRR